MPILKRSKDYLPSSHSSLSEVNASVETNHKSGFFGKLFAFLGPAYLVSVGYMDPGNWATDIAAGSSYGYKLLWVLLMSNLIALLLQSFCARLGIVRGEDLAQASRNTYPKTVNLSLYVLAEVAIAAMDLAEVLGMAIGLQLLFGLPILAGISISVLDTFLILMLMSFGIRKLEAFILSLVLIIGLCFLSEIIFAKPYFPDVAAGLIPSLPDKTALYLAIGIIGATVMPHNLYLHSALVQTRKFSRTVGEIKKAIRYNTIDSAIALNFAFFVNAAILILAASTFYINGMFNIAEIKDAHKLLAPLLGNNLAPILFAVALIASGQSSTITGTLAGQIVMEGYLDLRIQPWLRRLITRMLAVVPSFLVIYYFGEEETGKMLVFSQVLLSLQLGFATIPLIHFVSDKIKMGEFVIPLWQKVLAWISATLIIGLNLRMVLQQIVDFTRTSAHSGYWLMLFIPLLLCFLALLLYIIFMPFISKKKARTESTLTIHPDAPLVLLPEVHPFRKVSVAVDFSLADSKAISLALAQGGHEAEYLIIHIVETAGAHIFGTEIQDKETQFDERKLSLYRKHIENLGFRCQIKIGYGVPKLIIPQAVKEFGSDLLVMGSHGHTGFKDMIFGTTINEVRHKLDIPVLVVR